MRNLILVITIFASACATRGPHTTIPTEARNQLLLRYMSGVSLEELARDYQLGDRSEARLAVRDAMRALTKRYYADR